MAMQVLVEPIESGYRATTGAPLNITATGATPEDALEEVGRQLAEKWHRGARLYSLPGIPSVRRDLPPPTDEEMREFWAVVEEHRRQAEKLDRQRYGVTDAPPAA